MACRTLIAWVFLAASVHAAPPPPFSDISAASGIAEAIESHHKLTPKWWLSGINLIDLDGDGHLDLFLGAHGQSAAVLLNDGTGHFRYVSPEMAAKIPPTEVHIAADVDEDGRADVQATYGDGGGLWYLNPPAHGAAVTNLNFQATKVSSTQGRENALIDLDRDGRLDWLHEDPSSQLFIELGDGHGNFKRGLTIPGYKETSPIPIDLNGDGYIDLIFKECGYHNEKTGRSRILMNDGRGGFTDRTVDCGLREDGLVIQGVGDLNRDGAPDLICLENGLDVSIYLNDGKGHFTKLAGAVSGMEAASKPHYANWGLAVAVDLDNDGNVDILMNGRNFLCVLRGTGDGHFEYCNKLWDIPDFSWATVDEGLCFGDIDNDGRLDLVVCGGSDNHKTVRLLHNLTRRENAWLRVRPIGATGNRAAAGAKIRVHDSASGKLLAYEQVVIAARQTAHSYYTLGETERHFGLGESLLTDVSVEFYPSGKSVRLKGVKPNQVVSMRESEAAAEPLK
jgi:hypothetical protein